METVESIAESLGKNEEKESKDATSAAGLLDKLSVGESKSEGEATKETPSPAEEKPKAEAKAEEASSADKA